MKRGKIAGVVRKAGDAEKLMWFKFYDADEFRTPPLQTRYYKYILCTQFMTSDSKKLPITWEGSKSFVGEALINRNVIRQFNDGFYAGRVAAYDNNKKLYEIKYHDGDSETVKEQTLLKILRN